jgi:prepilin-type N-terminal cleavage/methylation domain-containing protein
MERARRKKLDACRTRSANRGGFTLVELLTVITIMAVLVTLLLGAVQSVRRYVAAKATTEIFEALDAALQEYYRDWGSYPWSDTSVGGDYLQVDLTSANSDYAAIKDLTPAENRNAAILYVALTTRQRHGPYFRGGVSAANTMKTPTTGAVYHVFRDGWGRMIYYMAPTVAQNRARSGGQQWNPPTDMSVNPDLKTMPPVLESPGPDEFNDSDNMVNYGQLQ